MSFMQLKFSPGIVKDSTRYSAAGTWYDGNLVRFRGGQPEAWGGWVQDFEQIEFSGICRALYRVSDLSGFQWLLAATNRRVYAMSDDLGYDVTPIGSEADLGSDPIATTDGSSVIVISHTAHGALPGDAVIIAGATDTGGIPAAEINDEHIISGYVDNDSYEITVATEATSTTDGGGSSVTVDYLLHAGSEDQIYGGGWGSQAWGQDVWGGDPADGVADKLGIWSMDGWGEDVIACVNKGGIYYWDATNPDDRMVNIRDLTDADGNAPEYAEFIMVSHRDRHLLAFGATEFGGSNVAPMSVRWCDQEDILNWDESDTTGTAGSLPLSRGSRLLAAAATQQEILVWSDQAVYALRFIGAPFIYGSDMVADFSDIIGMKATAPYDSSVFWMGRSGIYVYNGRVEKIPCAVWDYVSARINLEQSQKVFGCTNRGHNEVMFFYPSLTGDGEVDSYLSLNVAEGSWTIGSLARTAWLDMDALNYPIAASTDGKFYAHEFGAVDGSTSPPSALAAYIESAPFELSSEGSYDKGDRMMFIRRIFPDLTFRDYDDGVTSPQVTLTLKMMDKPGSGFTDSTSSSQVNRSATIPVELFSEDLHVRLRGRAMVLRVDSASAGTRWRLGTPRIDVRTDGQR